MDIDYKATAEAAMSELTELYAMHSELGDITLRVTEKTHLTELMSKNMPKFSIQDQLRLVRLLDKMATLAEELVEKYDLEEATDDEY